MKKTTAILAAIMLLASTGMTAGQAMAAETGTTGQVIARNGSQPSGVGSNATFTGNVRHDPLFRSNEAAPYSASYVTFEPGARSFWHTHPTGQRLVVVSGVGLTSTEDGKVVEIKAGDVVWCPPDVKHWHGASPTTAMTHMALTGMKDGKNVTWMEEVSDEQYNVKE